MANGEPTDVEVGEVDRKRVAGLRGRDVEGPALAVREDGFHLRLLERHVLELDDVVERSRPRFRVPRDEPLEQLRADALAAAAGNLQLDSGRFARLDPLVGCSDRPVVWSFEPC